MRAELAARWTSFLGFAERRLPALTRLKRAETLPIALHRRRIYVVPTRFGLVYSGMLLIMLLGALNYSNNPAMLLTCLLGAAAYQSVFSGFGALNRIALCAIKTRPCHAGDALHLSLHFDSGRSARRALHVRMENADNGTGGNDVVFDMTAEGTASVETSIPALRRGWQPVGRIRIWCEYPFGLFHVWSWLHPQYRALVYPRAEANAPPFPESGSAAANLATVRRGGDELSMLRDYHPSDARRLIAWKASARHDRLLVKEFDRPQSREIIFDWHSAEGLEYEARISRLAAWVERAESLRVPYALVLPALRVGAGLGFEHQQSCLRALALLPDTHA
jgi:uncharacterized protein (DUF58 family)